MCGIAGYISPKLKESQDVIKEMCEVISHRGPDAQSYKVIESNYGSVALGHRRLSIIDLHETANQPMTIDNLTIIFNGEIYNYASIRKELVELNHKFTTQSDTEVALLAYKEWGEDCVHKFIGMFAIAIYDEVENKLKLIRDRAGVKPLHYYWDNEVFIFGSELKSLYKHPSFRKDINYRSVNQYLILGYVEAPATIFNHTFKVLPATILTFDVEEFAFAKAEYWNVNTFYNKPKSDLSYTEAKARTKDLLYQACSHRMVADVPVGIFLSGGYDSTLVTAMLQEKSDHKLKTFTIGVKDEALNEAGFAKEIAKRLGTDHHEIYCDSDAMLSLVEDIATYYDEPFGDSSAVATMLVSKFASEHVTVALSADGGDEVFAGYNRYDQISRLKKLRLAAPFKNLAKPFLPYVFKDEYSRHRILKLLENPSPLQLAQSLNQSAQQKKIKELFKIDPGGFKFVDYHISSSGSDLSQMMAYDYKSYLPNDILVKVDRATMSASIEGREPLLDHPLIEFVATLPDHFKIKDGVKKSILRDIVHDYIPKEIMDRPKMGFAVPAYDWLRGPLNGRLNYLCSENFLNAQGIFNYSNIQKLMSEELNKKGSNIGILWYLFVFQLWFEKWID